MNGTGNRNVRRSIGMLKEAFLRLLSEEPYDQITVSAVTREADLNRGTFYAHFDNMDDLLRSTMSDISGRISVLLDQAPDADFLDDPMPVLGPLGDYLGKDRELYQKLVSSSSVEPFINSLHETFCEGIRARFDRFDPGMDPRLELVMTEYLTSGVLGAYRAWLEGEYGDAAIGEVNLRLRDLVHATGRLVRP
ncbi:MAG: TetR/AcrR family transcriptional regulator [Atopobiaceae bacterium]|jgi:AcrR family transcriptional regulator